MSRTLKRKVRLKFFQDEDSGLWGVTHHNTIDDQEGDDAFDPFWDGEGLFHDVFEHAHEGEQYFQGPYKQNVVGEMVAMGALFYYMSDMCITRQPSIGWRSPQEVMILNTYDYISNALLHGEFVGGSRLMCCLPRLKPSEEEQEIAEAIEVYWEKLKNLKRQRANPSSFRYNPGRRGEYKNSVTLTTVRSSHLYGYRMAKDLVENSNANRGTLNEFITFWNDFCKTYSADELAGIYDGIDFYIYTRPFNGAFGFAVTQEIEWVAVFRSFQFPSKVVLQDRPIPEMLDIPELV